VTLRYLGKKFATLQQTRHERRQYRERKKSNDDILSPR
jgi:hypothetical protein